MRNKLLTLLTILLSAIRPLAAETITHDISTGPISITKGGSYVVTGYNNEIDTNTITIDVADGQTVDLTLRDIYLQTKNTHPIEIKKGKVELTLEGDNNLRNYGKSVVQVSAAGSLTVDGPGYLDIIASYDKPSFGDEANPDTPTNVTILGGTINDQSGKSAPLSINGGSVKGRFTEKTGKRLVTVTPINQEGSQKDKDVATLTQPEGYGYLGMRTDYYGRLYLWLPEGKQTVSLTLKGDERPLTGSIDVKGGSENNLTITMEGSHKVTYSSTFNSSLEGFPIYATAGEAVTFSIKYEYEYQRKEILAATAEGVEIRPTGKPDQYTFTMPDHDVEIQLKENDLRVITNVEDGTELNELTKRNELVIKKGGAYTISDYGPEANTSIRIADNVTGDVSVTLRDLSLTCRNEKYTLFNCGNGLYKTTLILEGDNQFSSSPYTTENIPAIRKGTNGELRIEGTGTLEIESSLIKDYIIGNTEGDTKDITIAGGSIIANNYSYGYTVFGQGSGISLTGGSIKARAGWGDELLTDIGLTDGKHLVVVEGCDPRSVIRNFTAGNDPYNLKGMSPVPEEDEEENKDGKLYLWLPTGEQALTLVTEGDITYTGTVTVVEKTVNTCTLAPEEGTRKITVEKDEGELYEYVQIASLGKPGETIVFTAKLTGGGEEEIGRIFLLEFDTAPAGLEITRSEEDPDSYSFIMPDADVTLTVLPVAYDVVTEQTDGYQQMYSEGAKLVITQPGTYTIRNKKGLPISAIPIIIAHPNLFQGTEPNELEPIGPVTIILDGVNIYMGKSLSSLMNLSSTEVKLLSAEGSVNRLDNDDYPIIENQLGSLTIGGPGKLILEGSGQNDLIRAAAGTSVTFDNAHIETSNLDEDGLNNGQYGISTQTTVSYITGEDCPPFPLHITGGTLTADYIGAPATEPNARPVTISGGSIRCKELRNPISEDGKTRLQLTTVTLPAIETRAARATDGGEEIPVTRYSGLNGYSLDNAYADSEGRLYLWLPEGATYPDVRINNGVGSVTAGQAITLAPKEVTPDITYYDITLPEIEGATTQPEAGTYTVEEGTDFSFTLTLAEGYEQSVPIVTLSDGRTLVPDNRGQYVISYVDADLTVSITGIEPDIPTGIASADSDDILIEAGTGYLRIRTPHPVSIQIVRTDGEPSVVKVPAGDTLINGLASGIYFVRPDERRKAHKLIVH